RFFLMMVWSLFIIGLMGLFFYNKKGSIIPMVVLPTTEIIEPFLFYTLRKSNSNHVSFALPYSSTACG
ncbi:hypothetical protein, partial [Streptococcus infantis]|uniref:hypothetical protein n=1 Tax=Streptococcus infantis TaxID=68892 RepID=UPI0039C1CA89